MVDHRRVDSSDRQSKSGMGERLLKLAYADPVSLHRVITRHSATHTARRCPPCYNRREISRIVKLNSQSDLLAR